MISVDFNVYKKAIKDFIDLDQGNFVQKEIAARPDLAGMRIFDEPVFGCAAADDPVFEEFKKPGIIGPHFTAPAEWLPHAKSVISLFLPFTKAVREANRRNMDWPADEWIHARMEGQDFQRKLCQFIISLLEKDGHRALAPMTDPRFSSKSPLVSDPEKQEYYTSNWSERHAAYAAGLGTFGLSKGLITEKGMAGRFISVISSAIIESSNRPYTGIYDYCIRCGACVRNCPVKAITLEKGKIHSPCSAFLDLVRDRHVGRYGCGKCQIKVPCEFQKPAFS